MSSSKRRSVANCDHSRPEIPPDAMKEIEKLIAEAPPDVLAMFAERASMTPEQKQKEQELIKSILNDCRKASAARKIYYPHFPPELWERCCENLCFLRLAMDGMQMLIMAELIDIHRYAKGLCAERETISSEYQTDKDSHKSAQANITKTLEHPHSRHATLQQENSKKFLSFVEEVLPFLKGFQKSPEGTKAPENLCIQAIRTILGVSRNSDANRGQGDGADENELLSIFEKCEETLQKRQRTEDK